MTSVHVIGEKEFASRSEATAPESASLRQSALALQRNLVLRGMLAVVLLDLANCISLASTLASSAAVMCCFRRNFDAALSFSMLATIGDWLDGIMARARSTKRTDVDRVIGAQLDSLGDVINFAVSPSVFLLCYTDFSLFSVAVCFLVYIPSVLVRLSVFNALTTFGSQGPNYVGLSADFNAEILALVYLSETTYDPVEFMGWHVTFDVFLALLFVVLALFNTSVIEVPKLKPGTLAFWLNMFVLVSLTIFYAVMAVRPSFKDFAEVAFHWFGVEVAPQ